MALRQAQGYSRDTKISRVSSAHTSSTADVIVIGGGLIGTSISWRLRQAGVDVVMVVGERSSAASGVAAGMLAPITETTFTEQRLLQLNIASLSRYPRLRRRAGAGEQSANRTSPYAKPLRGL